MQIQHEQIVDNRFNANFSTQTLSVVSAQMASGDIVDEASATGSHDSLVAAINHVGLTDTLKGDGPLPYLPQLTGHLPMQALTSMIMILMKKMDSEISYLPCDNWCRC